MDFVNLAKLVVTVVLGIAVIAAVVALVSGMLTPYGQGISDVLALGGVDTIVLLLEESGLADPLRAFAGAIVGLIGAMALWRVWGWFR